MNNKDHKFEMTDPITGDKMTSPDGIIWTLENSDIEKTKMWEYMRFCNGEIRVMPGRYGGGWLAVGCAVIEWEFDEQWSDLVGGDNDYFFARDFFNANEDIVLIEGAASAKDAFFACAKDIAKGVDEAPNA